MKTSCIIVDDEPLAIKVMRTHIDKIPNIEIMGCCANAMEAFPILCQQQVDLLFLDIQMPQLTGMDFLRSLSQAPKVIITTAYREYALEGFELDIVDYLLKPISFERLLKAINKYYKRSPTNLLTVHSAISGHIRDTEAYIYVKGERKILKVFISDILLIESLKDYVKIYTKQEIILTRQQISQLEEKLPKERFIRIHRSYIVSIASIKAFTADTIEVLTYQLPIGRSYKSSTLSYLNYKADS